MRALTKSCATRLRRAGAKLGLLASVIVALAPVPANAQDVAMPGLHRDPRMQGPVPVPAAERDIPTVFAQRWYTVTAKQTVLEGAAFDGADLLFCDVGASRVLRITPDRRSSIVLDEPGLRAGGLALHRDGRIFAAAARDLKRGTLGVIMPDEGRLRPVLSPEAGYVPNDLVFDRQGGFYFTDFRGSAIDPVGGVYYVAPDMRTVTPIATHLALANGIALSPDGKYLWVTEFGRNRLLRIKLKNTTTVADLGISVVYDFIGPAPDSMRVDAEGNVYVALNGQGRILILSPGGIPIGQILLPGRDQGHFLESNSLALKPGTNEIYIVAGDGNRGQGTAIFRARGFAQALPLFGDRH